ncbi:MAG: hypothetical protein R3D85_06825 [Paracoccaceae bacterium]
MTRGTMFLAALLGFFVAGPFGSGAIRADDPPQPGFSPEERDFLKKILELPYDRQSQVMESLKAKPSQEVLNCVCRAAGYGSSSTSQYWHPDTIGTYDKRYSCQHPGDPCIVSGFGCTRHPAPSDVSIWEGCARRYAAEDGKSLMTSMLEGKSRESTASDEKIREELEACKARWLAQIRKPKDPLKGLAHLKAQGVPILQPPGSVVKEMKKDNANIEADLARVMGEGRKEAAKKADATLAQQLEKAFVTDANKKAALENMAALGQAYVETEMAELAKHKAEMQATIRQLQSAEMSEENDRKLADLKSKSWKVDAQLRQLNRDKDHLGKFLKAVDLGADIASLQGVYDDATSGDNRKLAGALISSSELAKKYVDKFLASSVESQDQIFAKLGNKILGSTHEDFASAAARRKLIGGMSEIMGETIKAANWSAKTYDSYKAIENTLKEVDRLASSGRYTQAQARLQLGMKAMSKLSAEAAAYLPAGMSDMMTFYSEALQSPAKFDELIRKFVNQREGAAQITSDQANTPAMNSYLKKYGILDFLIRDQYLYKEAGLSAYAIDPPKKPGEDFVLMPDADGEPIYLSKAQYDQLAKMAYAFPIVHGRRMTDADVQEQFGSMGAKGKVNVDDLLRQAAEKLERAEIDAEIAALYGKKKVSFEETSDYYKFRSEISDRLPKACVFSPERMKALFGAWRSGDRDGVLRKVAAMGDRMKAMDAASKGGAKE